MSRVGVLVAGDGESKCAKTFTAEHLATEAQYQKDRLSRELGRIVGLAPAGSILSGQVLSLGNLMFTNIVTISAGNFFRGAGLYAERLEWSGRPKRAFARADTEPLRELMAEKDILEQLQTDSVGNKASAASRLPGALALCETAFCETIREEYHRDGGGHLVITDARNPLNIFARRGLVGSEHDQIDPLSVIPYYIDTPAEVAAGWLTGDYDEQLANIRHRRHSDATRPEHPITVPTNLIGDFDAWWDQFVSPRHEGVLAAPYHLINGANTEPAHTQWLGGKIVILAQDLFLSLNQDQSPV